MKSIKELIKELQEENRTFESNTGFEPIGKKFVPILQLAQEYHEEQINLKDKEIEELKKMQQDGEQVIGVANDEFIDCEKNHISKADVKKAIKKWREKYGVTQDKHDVGYTYVYLDGLTKILKEIGIEVDKT